MQFKGALFDLDGVIVCTDRYHYLAWKELADSENIYFDEKINERLRGVSRMQSLEIILERADKQYSEEEKIRMAEEKNARYCQLIQKITPSELLDGVRPLFDYLKKAGVRIALCSSSKNAKTILALLGIAELFDAVVDGNDIERSKPDPQVFALGAERLGIPAQACVVFEDAEAGLIAGKRAGMKTAAVGTAEGSRYADYSFANLADPRVYGIFKEI